MARTAPPSTGLLNQWRADDLSVANGVGVQTWTATVGSNNLTQATSGNRPLMATNAINGKKALNWGSAANTRWMSGTITSDAQPTTWYAVVMPDSSISTNQHQVAHATQEAFHTETGGWKGYAGNTAFGTTGAGTIGLGTWQIIVMEFEGGTGSFWQNGTLLKSATIGTSASGTTLNIGRHSNNSRFWRGYIAEVGRYSGNADSILAELDSYGQDFYGIAVADYVSLDIDRARVGSSIPTFMVGTSSVDRLYVGSTQIWP